MCERFVSRFSDQKILWGACYIGTLELALPCCYEDISVLKPDCLDYGEICRFQGFSFENHNLFDIPPNETPANGSANTLKQ